MIYGRRGAWGGTMGEVSESQGFELFRKLKNNNNNAPRIYLIVDHHETAFLVEIFYVARHICTSGNE